MPEKDEGLKPMATDEKIKKEKSFSNTIKNAHASGDGSIKRSDEAIDTPKDALPDQHKTENTY